MKYAVLTPRGFEMREVPVPRCGLHDVLVKTIAIGICEGAVFRHRAMTSGLFPASQKEMFLGHEGNGRVVKVGRGVIGFKPGDVVTALGGAYAEYFVCKPGQLLKLRRGSDPRWNLGEPVACAMHAMNRSAVRPGDRVAVIGCGYMGLLCLQMANLMGASHVLAMDVLDWRLSAARRLGADAVFNPKRRGRKSLVGMFGEFDVVIEATGLQEPIDMATELVKQHGQILIIGYHQSNNGMRTVNMERWNFKAADVLNGHVRREDEKMRAMRASLELVHSGRLEMKALTAVYPFQKIEKAFHDLIARKRGLFKISLVL